MHIFNLMYTQNNLKFIVIKINILKTLKLLLFIIFNELNSLNIIDQNYHQVPINYYRERKLLIFITL